MSTNLLKLARGRKPQPSVAHLDGHWEGCEHDHLECLIQRLADEIERLRDCISAREVRSLVDERDRLRAERDSFYMDYRIKCDEETKRQAVEIERLRADAERYRFLRTGTHWPCVFADHDDPEPLCELELDIAIDTAMVPDSVVDKAWQRFEQAVQQPAAEVANPFAKLNKEGK